MRVIRTLVVTTLLFAALSAGVVHAQTPPPSPPSTTASTNSNFGLPAINTPADSKTGGAAGLHAFLGIPFGDMYDRGMHAALAIFAALVAIELLLLSATMALRQASFSAALGEWLQRAVKALIIIGVMPYTAKVFGAIQSNACALAMHIASGSTAQSVYGAGSVPNACTALSPVTIFLYGLTHGAAVFLTNGGVTLGPITVPVPLGIANPAAAILETIAWIGIVGAFTFIAADLLIILVESQIVLGLGIVFLGFLGMDATKFLGRGILHYASTVLLRLFFVYAFVGVGIAVVDQIWDNAVNHNGFASPSALLEATVTPLVFAWLTHRMDKIASSITSGSSHMNVRDEIVAPIANAIKTAVTAAVVVAAGGSAAAFLRANTMRSAAGAASGSGEGGAAAAAPTPTSPIGPRPDSGSAAAQPAASASDTTKYQRVDDRARGETTRTKAPSSTPDIAAKAASQPQPPPPAHNPHPASTADSAQESSAQPKAELFSDGERQTTTPASVHRTTAAVGNPQKAGPASRPSRDSVPPKRSEGSVTPPTTAQPRPDGTFYDDGHETREAAAVHPASDRTYDDPAAADAAAHTSRSSESAGDAPTKKRRDRPPSDWRARAEAIAAIRRTIHTHLDWHVERTGKGTAGISAGGPPV
jgi:P-type conjugative transfer protein TrbL